MLRRFVPHFFTLLNLLCGSIAAVLAVQNHLAYAALFVGFGIFFDFFDGFFARLLKVGSSLGIQLDSLADMVTSGLVPGIVMMQLLIKSAGQSDTNLISYHWETRPLFSMDMPLLALLGFLITLASAFRLAKFNIDTRQTSSFIGLPTPANAILILSLPLIALYQPSPRLMTVIFNRWFLIGLTLFSCVLLNAELPLFGLKFKNWTLKENWHRYIFLILSLVGVIVLKFVALPIIILLYVMTSVVVFFWEEH